ncbi:hypothetical protein EVG20_g11030 [Dentipellis fragilis]|uniref:Carboxylesterase type B domain-containing protein n=1 Tax=Dentipellis fragilis TaxID=205917 RepID=A0A4Y9XS64_9AGAM|nr:hypothetical protein EVG20_g11030 [Dentipellis fragilis]
MRCVAARLRFFQAPPRNALSLKFVGWSRSCTGYDQQRTPERLDSLIDFWPRGETRQRDVRWSHVRQCQLIPWDTLRPPSVRYCIAFRDGADSLPVWEICVSAFPFHTTHIPESTMPLHTDLPVHNRTQMYHSLRCHPKPWQLLIAGLEHSLSPTTPEDEDCLTVNVITPANVSFKSALPVLVYIYGGGFEVGATAVSSFDGSVLVNRSVALGEPFIFVSMNYRLNAFGFLASKEIKDAGAGNLGLHDQRQALRRVQKYIHAFGGDHSKVTIYGISAGSMSVALHMLTNGGNTEGLFHAGFMESLTTLPIGDISHGQHYYDALVERTGCADSQDTLECLRQVPYTQLKPLIDQSPYFESYQAFNLAWPPRVDGVFLKDTPTNLVSQGSVADIPVINGDADDEGTFFVLFSTNITTEEETRVYLQQNYFSSATKEEIDQLLELYPSNPTQGSPFDTGDANAFTPQFKRLAAFTGDYILQMQRRFFLQQRSGKQPIWSFLACNLKKYDSPGPVWLLPDPVESSISTRVARPAYRSPPQAAHVPPEYHQAIPVVKLDNGSFTGRTSGDVNLFLGIPFARPPVGNLRFSLPVPHEPYTGTYDATAYGSVCPQQDSNISFPALPPETLAAVAGISLGLTTPENEDCLTVNVITPANVSSKAALPVLVYIYGGAFEVGATATHLFDGSVLVNSSVALGEPIIFVSMNYR